MGGNLKSYLRLFRVRDWLAYFLMAVFGFFISKGFTFPLEDIIIFFVLIILFLAFGFSVNDCFDVKEDKDRKDKINPIANKEINFKNSLILSILPGILGLILSIIYGWGVFLFCLAGLTVSFFYSAPPLRLKGRPLLDLISHGFFAGIFWFLLPLLVFQTELNLFHYLISFSIFYLSLTLELRNHLEDFNSDRQANLKTSVCVFGYKNSEKLLRYLVIFYPFSLFPIYLLFFWQYIVLFLIFTIVFLVLFLLSKNHQLVKNYRILDAYSFLFLGLLAMS